MLVQVGEAEFDFVAGFQIEQRPVLEIAGLNAARLFARRDALDVIECLPLRLAQIEAAALLFDQQRARPEQVDEAVAVIEQFDALLVDRDLSPLDPKHREEIVVEALRVAALVGGVGPVLAEPPRAPPDLVPAQPHALLPVVAHVH